MYLVVCYDVAANRRRSRLHKRLRARIRAVQKSVFEGELPTHEWGPLLETIMGEIDMKTDTVRLYRLCEACKNRVEMLGTAEPVPDPDEDWVV